MKQSFDGLKLQYDTIFKAYPTVSLEVREMNIVANILDLLAAKPLPETFIAGYDKSADQQMISLVQEIKVVIRINRKNKLLESRLLDDLILKIDALDLSLLKATEEEGKIGFL